MALFEVSNILLFLQAAAQQFLQRYTQTLLAAAPRPTPVVSGPCPPNQAVHSGPPQPIQVKDTVAGIGRQPITVENVPAKEQQAVNVMD